MKLLILTSSYPINKTESQSAAGFVRDFALELSRNGHEVSVLTQSKEGVVEDDSELNIIRFKSLADKPLSLLKITNPFDLIKILSIMFCGQMAVNKICKENKPDLIISLWAVPCGVWSMFASKRFGIKSVVWALGSDIWSYGRSSLTSWIVKSVLKSTHKNYADGFLLAKEVERLSGGKCDFLATSRILPAISGTMKKSEKIKFTFIGRYHKNKGVDVLVEALNKVDPNVTSKIQVSINGGGPQEEYVQDLLEKYNLKSFVNYGGFVTADEVSDIINVSDCVIVPSRIESIPCVLSDSLQMKVPVIVTDVGDMGELVSKYKAGIVVEPENPDQLAKAIENFVTDIENKDQYSNGVNNLYEFLDIRKSAQRIVESEL